MSSKAQAILWYGVAIVMAVWTMFDFYAMRAVLGVLALIMGTLMWIKHRMIRRELNLTENELESWRTQLIDATPVILEMSQAKRPVTEIAEEVEKKLGLPREVTLKYIIALGRYQEQSG
ncbi:MAG: hypothetical protein HUU55_00920 [Myxococcales bacterium]|nr:hypothetical protein [Myxococcales bacterium]